MSPLAPVGADVSHGYFDHLGWASALWIAGAGVWLGFLDPGRPNRKVPSSERAVTPVISRRGP
jgi:hypothetical protein